MQMCNKACLHCLKSFDVAALAEPVEEDMGVVQEQGCPCSSCCCCIVAHEVGLKMLWLAHSCLADQGSLQGDYNYMPVVDIHWHYFHQNSDFAAYPCSSNLDWGVHMIVAAEGKLVQVEVLEGQEA